MKKLGIYITLILGIIVNAYSQDSSISKNNYYPYLFTKDYVVVGIRFFLFYYIFLLIRRKNNNRRKYFVYCFSIFWHIFAIELNAISISFFNKTIHSTFICIIKISVAILK